MHAAVKDKNLVRVDRLIRRGADLDLRDDEGATPLMLAVEKQDEAIVDALLSAGADPNIPRTRHRAGGFDDTSPLIHAVKSGNQMIVKMLIEAKPNINYRRTRPDSMHYETALDDSLYGSHWLIAAMLIQAGADLAPHDDGSCLSPLYYAAHWAPIALTEMMLQHGAPVNWARPHDPIILGDCAGNTILHSMYRSPDKIRLLVQYGADPNATNSRGETPLYMAVTTASVSPAAVSALIISGSDPFKATKHDITPIKETRDPSLQILLDSRPSSCFE